MANKFLCTLHRENIMKILMTGGTGFVGSRLAPYLSRAGHEVSILSREPAARQKPAKDITFVHGDPNEQGDWQDKAAEYDTFINLAGTNILQRWNPEYKKMIRDSRIGITRNLVEAIPFDADKTLFSASAVGYYGFHEDEILDESDPPGDNFLATLAVDWEQEALAARKKGARVVLTRFGIVMGKGGGALVQMMRPFTFFVGGPLGSGRQWFSWVHLHDLMEGFVFLLNHPELSGPFNLTSPNPVRNRDMAKALGKVMKRPSWFPAPGFMIRLILGEFGSVILKGQRVVPKRLLDAGFSFTYPDIESTFRDLVQ